MHILMLVLIGL